MIKNIFLDGKEIIIIGTAHISKKNQEQVKDTIDSEKPDVVAVELDKNRFYGIMSKKERKIKFSDIFKSKKPGLFLVYYFLFTFQKKIAKKFNIQPGAEMIQAIKSAKENNAKLLLADRDAQLTLQKLLKTLSFRDKINLFLSGPKIKKELGDDFDINTILQETEKKEDSEKLNNIMKIFMKRHKKLKKIMIDERDQFIAYNLQQAVKDPLVNKIVCVVGAGHLPGIIENIDNKNINIKKILSLNK
jgi:pheromone shutdown-related protein TraB